MCDEVTKLTRGELEVLLDRLDGAGPDCVAESMTSGMWFECVVDASAEEVAKRAYSLLQLIKELHGIPAGLPYLERQVLINCVEASTWQFRGSAAQNAQGIKMLERLADKMISAGVAERIDVWGPEEVSDE